MRWCTTRSYQRRAQAHTRVRALQVIQRLQQRLKEPWWQRAANLIGKQHRIAVEGNTNSIGQCIATFSQIIRLKPEFAKAWNIRATVYYFKGDLKKSLADCDEALRYFEKAYAINPTMQGVAQTIKDIRRLQEREGAKRT
jgi:tetratricopeptide (TPR) repeat protein